MHCYVPGCKVECGNASNVCAKHRPADDARATLPAPPVRCAHRYGSGTQCRFHAIPGLPMCHAHVGTLPLTHTPEPTR